MPSSPRPASSLKSVLRLLSLPKIWRVGPTPMIAGIVLAVIVIACLAAPLYVPYDPLAIDALHRLKGSSAEHLLGIDSYDRHMFSRVVMGGRISLLIGVGAAVISVAVGLVIGLVSGFFRTADAVIMRIMDSLMAIPSILSWPLRWWRSTGRGCGR